MLKTTEYGAVDLWTFHLTDEAREVRCNGQRTFLRYLCSRGTFRAILLDANPTKGQVTVLLEGPKCDDGHRTYLRYLLAAQVVHDEVPFGLTNDEKRILVGVSRDALSRTGDRNAHSLLCHTLRLPRVV